MKKIFFVLIWLALFPISVLGKPAKLINLHEVLALAERNSYLLSANQLKEVVADKAIDIARANYYPNLSVEAIDSGGFPGSTGLLNIGGLMGSPFRSGFAIGLFLQQTIWDFGRTTTDVALAKYLTSLSREGTQVTAYKVKLFALQTFYACSMYRTQRDVWKHLVKESSIITNEVQHFVSTGQRSVVDEYLSEAQTEEARTGVAFFSQRLKNAKKLLGIIIGVRPDSFSCPPLPSRHLESIASYTGIDNSPLLKYAVVDSEVAVAQLRHARAEYSPKLVALGSVGAMQHTHLFVPNQGYAVGIGLTVPILDFHTLGAIRQAEAVVAEKNESIAAEEQGLLELNGKYDETIDSSKVQLIHLNYELSLADEGFKLAKQRYFSLQGDLVDLREAFRNLTRAETNIIVTRAELLRTTGEKLLIDGHL